MASGQNDDDHDNQRIFWRFRRVTVRRLRSIAWDAFTETPWGYPFRVAEKAIEGIDTLRELHRDLTTPIVQEALNSDVADLMNRANSGDLGAMTRLGILYKYGIKGLSKDHAKARRWIHSAASRGSAEAQYELGCLYGYNWITWGVDRYRQHATQGEIKNTLYWLRKAADQNYEDAEAMLAHFYLKGKGVTKDFHKAITMLENLANRNNEGAQFTLAHMHLYGGLKYDPIRAEYLFRKAYQKTGDSNTKLFLQSATHFAACAYQYGNGVPQDYKEAMSLHLSAVDLGSVGSLKSLGDMHLVGQGVQQSYVEAVAWYEKASASGNCEARTNLAACYAEGLGVEKNEAKAVYLFERAGTALAKANLAEMYKEGRGVPVNYNKAYCLARESAMIYKEPKGYEVLAEMYEKGLYVQKNYAEAMRLYRHAIAKEDGILVWGGNPQDKLDMLIKKITRDTANIKNRNDKI